MSAALLCFTVVVAGCDDSNSLSGIRDHQANGEMARTIDPLRRLIDDGPSQPELHFLLGRALFLTGESGAAIWPLRKAVEAPEYAVDGGIMLTRAMLGSRFKRDGILAANAVLAIEPDNVTILTLRAQAYSADQRHVDALTDIDRVLELDPGNMDVLAPRVVSLLFLEQIEEAEKALADAREQLAESEEKIPEAIKAKLCVVDGMFSFERGQLEKADELYKECVEKYPTDALVVTQAVAMYDRRGQPERATEVLKQALELSKESNFRAALARRANSQGNADEAKRLLREDAEEKDTTVAWFTLADHLVKQEDFDGAVVAFERAVSASPKVQPMVVFAYADSLIIAGQYDKARQVGKQLDSPALGELIEGRVRLEEGNPRGALESFEAGVKLWPANPGARFLAGQAAEQLGDFGRAESQYREAIRAGQEHTDASLYLARLLKARGMYAAALERIGSFVRTHPTDPDGIIMSVRLAHRLGRKDIVVEGLKRLVRLPGQTGVAFVEGERLAAGRRPPEAVIQSMEKSGMDLTEPSNAPALGLLIDKLAALGRHEEATAKVEAALALHPESPDLHAQHARALRAAEKPLEEVGQAYERALKLAPEHSAALAGHARVKAESGSPAEAIELYDRASIADSTDSTSARSAVALMRASLPTPEFEARLNEFLRRHPHDAELASELAQIAAAGGKDPARALALAQRAAVFDSSGSAARRAYEAVVAAGAMPQAETARAELERRAAVKKERSSGGAAEPADPADSSASAPPESS